jgi:hypothetical protein
VVAVVTAAAPGLKIKEAELKVREDRRYYDVEGVLPDGAEIEFDLLETGDAWKIVETQRDIAWTATPQPVRDAAVKAAPKVAPVRVIESTQADGAVIYELFAEGQAQGAGPGGQLEEGRGRQGPYRGLAALTGLQPPNSFSR